MEGGDDFFDRGFEVGLTDSYNGRSDALYRAPIRGPGPIYGRYKGDTNVSDSDTCVVGRPR